jgi:hypothetical protein
MSGWYEDPKLDLLVRLAIAVPLFVVGICTLVGGARLGGFAAAGAVLLAAACFIGAGIAIAPWVAQRCGNLAGTIFYPDRHFDRPQPVFSIAEGKRTRGLPHEALAEYERVLLEYPQETRCYISMMDIAARDLRDPALAEGYFQRSVAQISDPDAVKQLRQARDEILRDFQS